MKQRSTGQRLMIYVEETDHAAHHAAFVEIVRRARRSGMAGATVVKGFEGFGGPSRVHRAGAHALSVDVPVIVSIVDTAERIESFVASLEDLDLHGLMVRQPVEIIAYGRS